MADIRTLVREEEDGLHPLVCTNQERIKGLTDLDGKINLMRREGPRDRIDNVDDVGSRFDSGIVAYVRANFKQS